MSANSHIEIILIVGFLFVVIELNSIKGVINQFQNIVKEIRELKCELDRYTASSFAQALVEEIRELKDELKGELNTYRAGSFAQALVEEISTLENSLSSIEMAIDNIKDR